MPSDPILLSLDATAAGPSLFTQLVPFALMLLVFYFVLIRPQQKEAAERAKLVASLQKGDKVVTEAGIHGQIHEAVAETLVLEISPNAYLTVDRATVRRKLA